MTFSTWFALAFGSSSRTRPTSPATYVEDHGFTPFDALHLVESDGETIVSSDDAYEDVAPRHDLQTVAEE